MGKRKVAFILGLLILIPSTYWLASPLFINVRVNETVSLASGVRLTSIATGTFRDADSFHRTSGTAALLQVTNGTRLIQLTDFKTTNGPDLYVYLATDTAARDAVNLGPMKGNIGDQYYSLPASTDLTRYNYVLIWCRTFSVLFGSAQLA